MFLKSPAYFMNRSHSFNAVPGPMPSVATARMLANRNLFRRGERRTAIPPSSGAVQFVPLMRAQSAIIYIIEDPGGLRLDQGQFSATAVWDRK